MMYGQQNVKACTGVWEFLW